MVGNKITKSAVPLSEPNLRFRSVISPPLQSLLSFYLKHASLFFAFRPLQKILSGDYWFVCEHIVIWSIISLSKIKLQCRPRRRERLTFTWPSSLSRLSAMMVALIYILLASSLFLRVHALFFFIYMDNWVFFLKKKIYIFPEIDIFI